MASIENRLEQIEKQLGEAGCVCSEPEHSQMAIIVIEKDWGPEQIERAESSKQFTCPTHGPRPLRLLRLSQMDANL
jgi:hypothetical protein